MPSEAKTFRPFPHDWQSTDYVAGWIDHDVARDPERRPLLRQMLSSVPFSPDAELEVLDVGGGYGVVTEEVLKAFPAAHVTLQDYSRAMLDQARRRLAGHAASLPARPPESRHRRRADPLRPFERPARVPRDHRPHREG